MTSRRCFPYRDVGGRFRSALQPWDICMPTDQQSAQTPLKHSRLSQAKLPKGTPRNPKPKADHGDDAPRTSALREVEVKAFGTSGPPARHACAASVPGRLTRLGWSARGAGAAGKMAGAGMAAAAAAAWHPCRRWWAWMAASFGLHRSFSALVARKSEHAPRRLPG